MRIKNASSAVFAGVENQSFDQRPFSPSSDDIAHLCRFFSLGRPKLHKKEHGIVVAHSNFFVFVATSRGKYALKFYPADAARSVAIEYAVNRFLVQRHFPTPQMHAGPDGHPCTPSSGLLATCFSYIDGQQAWRQIGKRGTIGRINEAMLTLKNILITTKGRIPFLKQDELVDGLNAQARASRAMAPYAHRELVHAAIKDACRAYQRHRTLFIRQWLHNDATLTNFLINKRTVYTLDLSHIREDYLFADLAMMVISCLFLDIPAMTTRKVVEDYLIRHQMGLEYLPVLNTLIRAGLIREYLKSEGRLQALDPAPYPPALVRAYTSQLCARKRSIAVLLKKMDDPARFIV